MKGIYLNFVPEYEIGVIKKLNFQIKSFNKLGVNIKKCKIIEEKFYIDDIFINNYHTGTSFKEKLLRKIDLYFCLKKLQRTKLYEGIDFIYIRYFYSSPWFISYLKFLKKVNLKVIIEIPTYPYDGEVKDNFFTRWDKKYREELHKYVDKAVTYSNDKEILGIICINISNGIDSSEISIIQKNIKKSINEINFIGVARIAFWHSFDRFILSMGEYYKNNPKEVVKFHIVGDGNKETVNALKNLVKENKLENYVIFYGYNAGKELDEIYNKADIGVGGLAAFRQGLTTGSGLKNREYCAKGIPFINGDIDNSFVGCKFVYKVPNENSLFSIKEIIEWYKNLNMTSEEIRKYAENNLSWDIQMKKVVESIKELI